METKPDPQAIASLLDALAAETTDLPSLATDPIDAWDARAVGARVVLTLLTLNGRTFRGVLDARSAHDVSNRLLAAAARAQVVGQGGA